MRQKLTVKTRSELLIQCKAETIGFDLTLFLVSFILLECRVTLVLGDL